jgi:hypothetical protein
LLVLAAVAVRLARLERAMYGGDAIVSPRPALPPLALWEDPGAQEAYARGFVVAAA